MGIDKLPGANGAYLSCDLPHSSTTAAAEPATTSNTKNTTAQTNLQHHDPIGGGTGIDTKPVDYQTWLNHTAPKPWTAGRTYKPGDQVIYDQNVYQLVGAWDSHDIRPDTWRSNWWYSGSVQNNYNYYAKLPPGTASYVVPNRPPIDMRPQPERPQNGLPTTSQFHDPTDGDTSNDTNPVDDPTRPQDGLSDAKSGNVKALKNLSEAFPDYFKAIGQDFTRTSVSFSGDSQLNVETAPRALAVYGGLNADNKLVEHYTFKSLGNAVNPERPFPNAIFQFIYLRPEDKDKLGTLDPGKYDTHYEDVEYIHPHPESDGTHTVWRTARFIMPKESSPAEIEKTPPDYGYLYLLDDGDPHAQQTLPGENSSIVISNFAGEKIPTTYKGP